MPWTDSLQTVATCWQRAELPQELPNSSLTQGRTTQLITDKGTHPTSVWKVSASLGLSVNPAFPQPLDSKVVMAD